MSRYQRCVHCQHGNQAHVDGAVCDALRPSGHTRCACSQYETSEMVDERVQREVATAVRNLGNYHRAVDDLLGAIGASGTKIPDEIMQAARRVVVAGDAQ